MIPMFPDTGSVVIDTAIIVAIITSIPTTIIAITALIQIFRIKKQINKNDK